MSTFIMDGHLHVTPLHAPELNEQLELFQRVSISVCAEELDAAIYSFTTWLTWKEIDHAA